MALPLFVFSEPIPATQKKTVDMDVVLMCKVKAIPEGYTVYDKIVVDGPALTFSKLFNKLKKRYNVDISLVECMNGAEALFDAFFMQGKHEPRRNRLIEDVYREVSKDPIPEGRNYLVLKVGGYCLDDGGEITMPLVKYNFAGVVK